MIARFHRLVAYAALAASFALCDASSDDGRVNQSAVGLGRMQLP